MMDSRARDEAAQWFVRLQEADLSSAERQRFDAWRNERPEHQYEFDVLQGLWSATDVLPKARLQALCDVPVERPERRAIWRYAVAASVVAAGAGQVTVTGTRFDVRRDDDQTRVVVEAGTVKVQGHAADAIVTLTAGRGTHIDGQGNVVPAYAVNAEELTAWRTGKLVFNNATLGEVAREVSRYREQPLRVGSAAVGNLRLTSVFKANDTEALLKALPHILPVAVRALPDGSQEIISR